MKKLFLAFVAIISIGLAGSYANYTMTQGAGTTFGSVIVGGFHYVQMFVCDLTTPAQCQSVSAAGAAKVDGSAVTQPISAVALPLPAGAATAAGLTTINTTLGTPMQSTGGSVKVIDAAGGVRGANVNAANQLTVSVDAGSVYNANGRATSANSSPMVPSAAPTTWHLVAAASNNATNVKASATTLFSCQLSGIDAAPGYLKIYNTASVPTPASNTPVVTLIIPAASTAANGAGSNVSFGPGGLALGTGFGAAIVTGIADNNNTSVAASTFVVNCQYE